MTKADIVQLQENGEPKYVATHASAVEGLSKFIQKDYEKLGNTEKIYVSEGRGDNSLADGSESRPYRTIQAAVDSLPLISSTSFYIFVEPGVYLEDIYAAGIICTRLEILSTKNEIENAQEENTSVFLRGAKFVDCKTYTGLRGITQTDPQSSSYSGFLVFDRVTYGIMDNCRVYVNTKSYEDYSGVTCTASNGSFYNSLISNQKTAVKATFTGHARTSTTLIGTGNDTVFQSYASIIYRGGTNITGSTEEEKELGGQIFS